MQPVASLCLGTKNKFEIELKVTETRLRILQQLMRETVEYRWISSSKTFLHCLTFIPNQIILKLFNKLSLDIFKIITDRNDPVVGLYFCLLSTLASNRTFSFTLSNQKASAFCKAFYVVLCWKDSKLISWSIIYQLTKYTIWVCFGSTHCRKFKFWARKFAGRFEPLL